MSSNLFSKLIPPERALDEALLTWRGDIWTYGDMDALSAKIAGALIDRGVQPGDRVAVQVEKTPQAIALYLATIRIGAVFLPLNTGYTDAEMGFFIGDADPRVIVCDPSRTPGLAQNQRRVMTLDSDGGGSLVAHADAAQGVAGISDVLDDDLAAILYTSGTTGRSKGAMLTHGNLAANAGTLRSLWGFTSADTLIHSLPIFHVHGLFIAINVLMMAGGRMIFLERFDPEAVIRALPGATTMMGVPTHYTRLLNDSRLTRDVCQSMRLFISGSAPLLNDTFHRFQERTGHTLLERYGMTETGMNTSNPLDGKRKPGTVGFPLPDVSARIVDAETGAPVAAGETGILEVKGPNVFKGYWGLPDKTAQEFRPDGFFITGDMARTDEEGYVCIVGRAKDLVISGGLNVYPKEVESVIDTFPGIRESAVIGIPHPDFGEAVVAVCARSGPGTAPGSAAGSAPGSAPETELTESAVIEACSRTLARFKVPKRVVFVDELPYNTMGKVQKATLRDTYRDLFS